MKNWVKNNLSYIIVLLILLLFFIIPIIKIWDFKYLFAMDPWHHMYFTQFVESVNFYWRELFLSDWSLVSHYPTFMRSYLYEFHLITNIDYIIIFKYFWFITRFFTVLFFILIINIFFKNKRYLLIWLLLLLSWYYFWFRSYITFTENFVILFHIIILYYSLLFLNKKKSIYFILSTFFVWISLYFHYPSAIIPFIIYFSTIFIYLFKNFNKKSKIFIIYNLIIFLLISFYSIIWVIKEYIWQINNNIWNTWGYWDLNRFTPPNLETYQHYQSDLIILFAIFWVLFILTNLKKIWVKYFPFLTILLLTFILSNWTRFYLNLPTDRMQWFLMIPIWITAFIWFLYIIKKNNYLHKIILSFCIIILSFNSVINSSWWFKLWHWEIPTWIYLQNNFNNKIKYYFDKNVSFQELQFSYYNNIIIKKGSLKKWDWIISRWKKENLELIYNNKDINIYKY